jgi:hypothetical protein
MPTMPQHHRVSCEYHSDIKRNVYPEVLSSLRLFGVQFSSTSSKGGPGRGTAPEGFRVLART